MSKQEMKVTMSGAATCLGALVLMTGVSSTTVAGGALAPTERKVYVSATAKDGTAVTDMTADDFEVKEDGESREVLIAGLTTKPLRMSIIVADGGAGSFQQALVTLLQGLINNGEFSLVSVVAQPDRIVDYTGDPETLVGGIQNLGQRGGRQDSPQLMDAIVESLEDVAKEGSRPVIVVMTMGGAVSSSTRADVVRENLRQSGTTLYAISPVGSGGMGSSAGGGGGGAMGMVQGGLAASEAAFRGRNLEEVLNDGVRDTGGRHVQVNQNTLVEAAQRIVDEQKYQYELTYVLPDGVEPDSRIEVKSRRDDVTVNAPRRIAD